MATYRVYQLTDVGRIARPPAMFESADDATAIEEAKKLLNGNHIELWEGSRLVAGLHATAHGQAGST